MKDLLYRSYSRAGCDRFAWRAFSNRLRILCYHGVCDDHLVGESWMPSYFVTKSAFEAQLQYLDRTATVLPLAEGVRRLREGALPPSAVCLTFDDGYANNLSLAAPLLERYGMTATVFLSTAYVESGDWYPFLKFKLIRLRCRDAVLPDYKTSPLDFVREAAARYWPDVEVTLTAEERETLRPMTVEEVRSSGGHTITFGAHSHVHAIARNEDPERRRLEVRTSVQKVSEWIGKPVQTYSYPNGEKDDFGQPEKEAFRSSGVDTAVTGIGGANRWPCDPLELRRYPLTLHHDDARFRAEVTGFRHLLLSLTSAHP